MPNHARVQCACALLLVLGAGPSVAAETGFTWAAADLRAAPFFDAPSLAKLPERTDVTILERQAGWMKVQAAGREGWVRLLAVRLGSPAADPRPGGWLRSLGFGASRPRASASPSASPTVTTGVRGLTTVEIQQAKPDPEQVRRLREAMATPERARSHAQQAGLSPIDIAPPEAPSGTPAEESR